MNLETPNQFGQSTQGSRTNYRDIRPFVITLLFAIFVTGSAAATNAVQSQNIEPDQPVSDSTDGMDAPALNSEQPVDDSSIHADVISENADVQSTASEGQSNSGSNTSIRIESHSETTVNGQTTESEPSVNINGQSIDLPSNGTYRKDIRDGDSRTRIRARIDADNTSLNITTNESVDSGSN